jgi:hypothetical protein
MGNLTEGGNRQLDDEMCLMVMGGNFRERNTVCSTMERGNLEPVTGVSPRAEGPLL